jgi:hypothetical protein
LIGRRRGGGAAGFSELAKIKVSGFMNAETIKGIKMIQSVAGLTVDGKVSPARGYKHGGTSFTIVSLNCNVKARFPREWPNIEEIPECPPILNLACRRALVGSVF